MKEQKTFVHTFLVVLIFFSMILSPFAVLAVMIWKTMRCAI
jgi:hypothetical protein